MDDTDNAGEGGAVRVEETGIALVHEGELIIPAAGSRAQAERAIADSRAVIHYHFPVEIEVRSAPNAIDPEDVIRLALQRLTAGMDSV
ncbi:MAG TPA: hypothetical protein VKB50_20540 [Vicinamibacterales bacterium]|nr:hypothetical protein [Vicinamibacterales bacterium]